MLVICSIHEGLRRLPESQAAAAIFGEREGVKS
jgi:hypothetical protein